MGRREDEKQKLWEEQARKDEREHYREKFATELEIEASESDEDLDRNYAEIKDVLDEANRKSDSIREMVGDSLQGKTTIEQAKIMAAHLERVERKIRGE